VLGQVITWCPTQYNLCPEAKQLKTTTD